VLLASLVCTALAQDGYFGYQLNKRGDEETTNYETASTPGVELSEEPDVYLNASVSVGEISIEVQNITAKINVDARVLSLLHFNAGVDASIDRVSLTIEDVTARVELEARLGNVVAMVGDVLNTIDLNPIVATLGNNIGEIVDGIADTVDDIGAESTASAPNTKRDASLDYNMVHNVLYSINDYSGQTHTNRILAQDGSIYDEFLDNNGSERGRQVVGSYLDDMSFTGHNRTVTTEEETEYELGYLFAPYPGLEIVTHIYVSPSGQVTRTRVVAEAEGGGTSTISNDDEI
jgi:hypothetical protein